MRIFITGGAGFIGSHACEKFLTEGHEVISVDNFNDFYDPAVKDGNIGAIVKKFGSGKFKSIKEDIRNHEAMQALIKRHRPEVVVHLAAMAGVRPSIKNPLLYEDVNIRGTQVLLDLCAESHIKNFIFASSSSVYGNNKRVPFSESDNVDHPISPYAASKKAGELICHTYRHLYGIQTVCLRFFTVYGPRQRPDLAIHKFTRLIDEDQKVPFYGDGTTERDYTYVDDITDGVYKAFEWTVKKSAEPKYDVFNLGESQTISLKAMVECLEKAVGKKAKLDRLPMQPGDVVRTYADISKSKKVLGYAPSTNFEAGIKKFVDWYRKRP